MGARTFLSALARGSTSKPTQKNIPTDNNVRKVCLRHGRVVAYFLLAMQDRGRFNAARETMRLLIASLFGCLALFQAGAESTVDLVAGGFRLKGAVIHLYSGAEAEGKKIVAVVGAGHVPGIKANMGQNIDMDQLNRIPEKGVIARAAGWIFSLAIISLFLAGFYFSGSQASINMILSWSIITASCAAAGALIMLSHPLTILASAVSAPIATLHPLIATGWVAGLTEAAIRKPQVKDFLSLTEDITSFRGFFRNKITRILILIAFVNLTTSLGTFVAIPVMMRYF